MHHFLSYTCQKIFATHTDRHFPEIVKRVQVIPKRVNPSKTESRMFIQNQYILLFIKESKKVYFYKKLPILILKKNNFR